MTKRKSFLSIICIMFALFFAGCNNAYAKEDYYSEELIAQEGDRYSKVGSVFNPIDGGYSFTVSEFDGRETLWIGSVEEEKIMEIDICFKISKGQAKIVHVDEAGNVTTILERLSENSAEEIITKEVTWKEGKNRIKIVGYDCEDIDLQLLFEEP